MTTDEPTISKAEAELRAAIQAVPISDADRAKAAEIIKAATDDAGNDTARAYIIEPGVAAALWLHHNKSRNRKLDVQRVYTYRDAMLRGEWKFNNMTIGILPVGDLGDGQHRLGAIALSGKEQKLWIVGRLDPEARDTIDRGTTRTTSQALEMMGISDPTLKAQFVKPALKYVTKVNNPGVNVGKQTDQQVEAFIHDHNDLIDQAVEITKEIHQHVSQPTMAERDTALCAFMALLGGYTPDWTRKWLHQAQDGKFDKSDSGGFEYFKIVNRSKTSRATRDKLSPEKKLALFVKAAHADFRGETVGKLAFDPKKEDLPDYHCPEDKNQPQAQAAE